MLDWNKTAPGFPTEFVAKTQEEEAVSIRA